MWYCRVILECYVDLVITFEVMWYKDNLFLNSLDYEIRYDRGVAIFIIEEIFFEDIVRYIVRLINEVGIVESFVYLYVRG